MSDIVKPASNIKTINGQTPQLITQKLNNRDTFIKCGNGQMLQLITQQLNDKDAYRKCKKWTNTLAYYTSTK